MTDIVERLRERSPHSPSSAGYNPLCQEAANKIERLRADYGILKGDYDALRAELADVREDAKLLRAEIERLEAERNEFKRHLIGRRGENERLRAALQEIKQWSRAYPLANFPKPDLQRAHKLLQAGGMTLDAVSADAMRHAIEGVGEIALAALEHKP